MAFPQLYKPGILGVAYTRTRFWLYMLDGLYQSAAVFFIPWAAYGAGITWSSDGLDTNSLNDLGSTIAFAAVLAANGYVAINTRYWTIITWLVYVISTLLIFIWLPIYSQLATLGFKGTVSVIFPTFNFWATMILTVFVCLGPRWLVRVVRQSYFPDDKDIIREAWIAGDLKDQLGLAHRRNKQRKRRKGKNVTPTDSPDGFKAIGLTERFMDDERGFYQAAEINSPRKPRSLVSSQDGREPFAYPPSPLARHALSSPPPLLRSTSDETPPLSLNGRPDPLLSPTSADAFRMAQSEIKRMSRSSVEIDRANMTPPHSASRPGPVRRSSSRKQTPTKSSFSISETGRYDQQISSGDRRPSFEMLDSVDFSSPPSMSRRGEGGGGYQ